jgi:hypothetical protein
MDNISFSVARSVLDELGPPPGLYCKNMEIKMKIEYDLQLARQRVIYLENELNTISKLIIAEQTVVNLQKEMYKSYQPYEPVQQPVQVKEVKEVQQPVKQLVKQLVQFQPPTDKFIFAVHELFKKNVSLQLSDIPHKLPANVLPPTGKKGLFTKWMDFVPGITKSTLNGDTNQKIQHIYISNLPQEKSKKNIYNKMCFQKNRGKPCTKLNDKGLCIFCN